MKLSGIITKGLSYPYLLSPFLMQIFNELVAPELARGEPRTPRTDVWAFGNILWEICHYGKLIEKQAWLGTLP